MLSRSAALTLLLAASFQADGLTASHRYHKGHSHRHRRSDTYAPKKGVVLERERHGKHHDLKVSETARIQPQQHAIKSLPTRNQDSVFSYAHHNAARSHDLEDFGTTAGNGGEASPGVAPAASPQSQARAGGATDPSTAAATFDAEVQMLGPCLEHFEKLIIYDDTNNDPEQMKCRSMQGGEAIPMFLATQQHILYITTKGFVHARRSLVIDSLAANARSAVTGRSARYAVQAARVELAFKCLEGTPEEELDAEQAACKASMVPAVAIPASIGESRSCPSELVKWTDTPLVKDRQHLDAIRGSVCQYKWVYDSGHAPDEFKMRSTLFAAAVEACFVLRSQGAGAQPSRDDSSDTSPEYAWKMYDCADYPYPNHSAECEQLSKALAAFPDPCVAGAKSLEEDMRGMTGTSRSSSKAMSVTPKAPPGATGRRRRDLPKEERLPAPDARGQEKTLKPAKGKAASQAKRPATQAAKQEKSSASVRGCTQFPFNEQEWTKSPQGVYWKEPLSCPVSVDHSCIVGHGTMKTCTCACLEKAYEESKYEIVKELCGRIETPSLSPTSSPPQKEVGDGEAESQELFRAEVERRIGALGGDALSFQMLDKCLRIEKSVLHSDLKQWYAKMDTNPCIQFARAATSVSLNESPIQFSKGGAGTTSGDRTIVLWSGLDPVVQLLFPLAYPRALVQAHSMAGRLLLGKFPSSYNTQLKWLRGGVRDDKCPKKEDCPDQFGACVNDQDPEDDQGKMDSVQYEKLEYEGCRDTNRGDTLYHYKRTLNHWDAISAGLVRWAMDAERTHVIVLVGKLSINDPNNVFINSELPAMFDSLGWHTNGKYKKLLLEFRVQRKTPDMDEQNSNDEAVKALRGKCGACGCDGSPGTTIDPMIPSLCAKIEDKVKSLFVHSEPEGHLQVICRCFDSSKGDSGEVTATETGDLALAKVDESAECSSSVYSALEMKLDSKWVDLEDCHTAEKIPSKQTKQDLELVMCIAWCGGYAQDPFKPGRAANGSGKPLKYKNCPEELGHISTPEALNETLSLSSTSTVGEAPDLSLSHKLGIECNWAEIKKEFRVLENDKSIRETIGARPVLNKEQFERSLQYLGKLADKKVNAAGQTLTSLLLEDNVVDIHEFELFIESPRLSTVLMATGKGAFNTALYGMMCPETYVMSPPPAKACCFVFSKGDVVAFEDAAISLQVGEGSQPSCKVFAKGNLEGFLQGGEGSRLEKGKKYAVVKMTHRLGCSGEGWTAVQQPLPDSQGAEYITLDLSVTKLAIETGSHHGHHTFINERSSPNLLAAAASPAKRPAASPAERPAQDKKSVEDVKPPPGLLQKTLFGRTTLADVDGGSAHSPPKLHSYQWTNRYTDCSAESCDTAREYSYAKNPTEDCRKEKCFPAKFTDVDGVHSKLADVAKGALILKRQLQKKGKDRKENREEDESQATAGEDGNEEGGGADGEAANEETAAGKAANEAKDSETSPWGKTEVFPIVEAL